MSNIFNYYFGSIKEEIKTDLIQGYKMETTLLICHLDEAGVETYHLQERDSLYNVVNSFLNLCPRYDLKKLNRIFRKLYKLSPGLSSLKKAQDILEKAIDIPPVSPPTPTQPPTPDPTRGPITEPYPKIYDKLEYFLQNEQWKEADLETMRVLIEIAGIENPMKDRDLITWLDKKDIDNIPDEALKTINKLWVKYSQEHFGFSVQAEIWGECRGKHGDFNFIIYKNKFAKRIGWYDGINWIKRYDKLDFSKDAKRGHLPSLSFPNQEIREIQWSRWKETFERFFPRLFKLID